MVGATPLTPPEPPGHVGLTKTEAQCDKCILTVTLPKPPGKGPKRVNVTS